MHGWTNPKPQIVRLQQCHAVIEQLGQELAQLREQVSALLDKKLNSRNSSKPPSSDGPDSGGNRAQRRASGRARGAQPGHKGTYRTLLAESEVDAVHDCPPPEVCECGGPVAAGRPMRHQVFDVPAQVEAEVQEYRLYHGVCGHCRKTHKSVLPAGVPRGQIGPRALALVGLLGTASCGRRQGHLGKPSRALPRGPKAQPCALVRQDTQLGTHRCGHAQPRAQRGGHAG